MPALAINYQYSLVPNLGEGYSIVQVMENGVVVGQGWDLEGRRQYAFKYDTVTGVTTKYYVNYQICIPDYMSKRVQLMVDGQVIFDYNSRPYESYSGYYKSFVTSDGFLAFRDPGSDGAQSQDILTEWKLGVGSTIYGMSDNALGLLVTVKTAEGKLVPYFFNPDTGVVKSYEASDSWIILSCNQNGQAMGRSEDSPSSLVYWDGVKLTTLPNIGAVVAPLANTGMALLLGYGTPRFYDTTTGRLTAIPNSSSIFSPTVLGLSSDDCFVGGTGPWGCSACKAAWWGPEPVPEPSTLVVMSAGLLMSFGLKRR